MTSYATRIRALFDEIDRTPWGPEERALVAEAVALAQESGDERLEYEARLRQTSSANMAGDTDLMLTSFAWCLAHHDADPERFPAVLEPAGDLLWQYKWMAAVQLPEFAPRRSPRCSTTCRSTIAARVGESRADGALRRRLVGRTRRGGDRAAAHAGGDAARRLQPLRRACAASSPASSPRRDEEDAIRLVQEMIDGGFSCGEEPEHALARTFCPTCAPACSTRRAPRICAATRSPRTTRQPRDHRRQRRLLRGDGQRGPRPGAGGEAPWLVHDGLDAAAHETALASFAVGLDAVAAAGHPDTPVRGSDAESRHAVRLARRSVDGIRARSARGLADTIAAAFDARNGTDAHRLALARLRDAARERYDVPIHSHEFSALASPRSSRGPRSACSTPSC
jgi:hypothetical protein